MTEASVFSVYEVSLHLKQVIETQIDELYVSGEISNFVHHGSGHIYFNLKDENASLRCTFFRGQNYGLDFKPEDGQKVVCFGKLTVFEKGGSYNLNVKNMRLAGKGNLALQFEMLKQKLFAEGLFDPSYKKAIPAYPSTLGIVTSPTGAALQDMLNIIKRRYPARVLVYPALVQGSEAPKQIILGIEYFNSLGSIDTIVITRGGGSQEDLFCFNDESLARAIFASRVPIVSAIGHEIDFTIADFVADLRAPTPSAAAELIVPDKKDILLHLNSIAKRMTLMIRHNSMNKHSKLQSLQMKLNNMHPEKKWQAYQQRFDFASLKLLNVSNLMKQKRLAIDTYAIQVNSAFIRIISGILHKHQSRLQFLENSLHNAMQHHINHIKQDVQKQGIMLQEQSPRTILSRGYAIVEHKNMILNTYAAVKSGDRLHITLQDGKIITDVVQTKAD